MNIPDFLNRDDYLQNPIMRRFLKDRKINFVENRADYIKAIEEYASQNEENEEETRLWLLKVIREGSKEICYKKLYGVEDIYTNPTLIEAKISENYPECPRVDVLSYSNTGNPTLIEYHIIQNEDGEADKIEFTFSNLFLYGEVGSIGNKTVLPVFIEVYLKEGFIVSRAKSKSTLFSYDENNAYLISENKVDTMKHAVRLIDEIIGKLGFETERSPKTVKTRVSKMLYKLYEKYSFTPDDVEKAVDTQRVLINEYVNRLFSNLGLDIRNKERALLDAKILAEKYISINGNNEEIFKKDRSAYLIKVSADDELELTKIDTTSDKKVPLQCTEAFFDSKKAVVKSKMCKQLNLIYKRTDETYFSKNNLLVVQLGSSNNYGYVKTMQYAEEADIQNVLQAVFENY